MCQAWLLLSFAGGSMGGVGDVGGGADGGSLLFFSILYEAVSTPMIAMKATFNSGDGL
jgi:hypothetical protein